jgi:hypothetical protein
LAGLARDGDPSELGRMTKLAMAAAPDHLTPAILLNIRTTSRTLIKSGG